MFYITPSSNEWPKNVFFHRESAFLINIPNTEIKRDKICIKIQQ